MLIFQCETCPWRRYAERRPDAILARIWRWHTGWCPGWKAYQRRLAAAPPVPQPGAAPAADEQPSQRKG